MDSDEHLCRAAQAGEIHAASELLEIYYERVFAYLRRRCTNDEDAADLTQKAFSRVWVSLQSYRGQSSFSTWVHSIAHHVYVDWRRLKHLPSAEGDEWWKDQPDHTPGAFESVAQRVQVDHVAGVLIQFRDEREQLLGGLTRAAAMDANQCIQ